MKWELDQKMIIKLINILLVLLIIFVFLFLALYERKVNSKNKKIILISTIVLLSVIGGYREIGTDLQSYRDIFNYSPIIDNYARYLKEMFDYNIGLIQV